MKKICIALDYNPSSEKVAQTGYTYAKALGAETTLVHVIENAVYYAMDYSPFMGYDSPFNNVPPKWKCGIPNSFSFWMRPQFQMHLTRIKSRKPT